MFTLHLIKIASVSDPSQATLSLFSSLLYILSIKIVLIKNYYYNVCLMFRVSNKLDLNQETRFTIKVFVQGTLTEGKGSVQLASLF